MLLIAAAFAALVLANSPWSGGFLRFWETPVGFRFGSVVFERSLAWIINDGLMVVFFLVVGLEIKREIHCGELSESRRAALPLAAALGGMLVPAGIYVGLANTPAMRVGWGTPMATDIAFAIGILALLGRRIPAALRVLLLALAVIDDLGAIVVIALFYSSDFNPIGLLVAALGVLVIWLMQRLGIRARWAYVPAGVVVWSGFYQAGIHPTIAGVVIGFMTPVRAWLGAEGFVSGLRAELSQLEKVEPQSLSSTQLAGSVHHVDLARREALSPAEHLIEMLHPWVAYLIMPLFALANAGVQLTGIGERHGETIVALAVAAGLLFGKPIGVLSASLLAVRSGFGVLPVGITTRHLIVLGCVAGVGFTMSLFIAQLAFDQPDLLAAAKLGILGASGCAAVLALFLGRVLLPSACAPGAATTPEEAEESTEL